MVAAAATLATGATGMARAPHVPTTGGYRRRRQSRKRNLKLPLEALRGGRMMGGGVMTKMWITTSPGSILVPEIGGDGPGAPTGAEALRNSRAG